MSSGKAPDEELPVLTDVVEFGEGFSRAAHPQEAQLDELSTALAVDAHELAEELVHQACRELEAILLERVSDRLKKELPELLARVLERHGIGTKRGG